MLGDRRSLELELFGKSMSTSRMLTNLYWLAQKQYPQRPLVLGKPVNVYIDAVMRDKDTAKKSETAESADAQYNGQLAKQFGQVNATFHNAYGAITSTASLSAAVVQMAGYEEGNSSAAFRVKGENISMGGTIGHAGSNPRRSAKDEKRADDGMFDDWSDKSCDEDDMAERVATAEALRRLTDRKARIDGTERKSAPRVVEVSQANELMLLRHLPLRHPCDPPLSRPLLKRQSAGPNGAQDIKPAIALAEGVQMQKRKKVKTDEFDWRNLDRPLESKVPVAQAAKMPVTKLGGLRRSFA